LSVDDLLMRQPDFDLEGDEAGAQVAAAVVARRSERQSEAYKTGEKRLEAERTAAAREVEKIKTSASREHDEREAERKAYDSDRRGWEAERQEITETAALAGRRTYRNVGVAFLAVLLLATLFLQLWPLVAATVLTIAVFIYLADEWTRDIHVSATRFIFGLIIELVGVAATFLLR
jgi:hypothetical protein